MANQHLHGPESPADRGATLGVLEQYGTRRVTSQLQPGAAATRHDHAPTGKLTLRIIAFRARRLSYDRVPTRNRRSLRRHRDEKRGGFSARAPRLMTAPDRHNQYFVTFSAKGCRWTHELAKRSLLIVKKLRVGDLRQAVRRALPDLSQGKDLGPYLLHPQRFSLNEKSSNPQIVHIKAFVTVPRLNKACPRALNANSGSDHGRKDAAPGPARSCPPFPHPLLVITSAAMDRRELEGANALQIVVSHRA
ncbi:hypothetical protein EVAR_88587_1 [Eumeta japonica]|uniref:Uncharacterized protein n=1 Tax=Eumeta variegata TaxID=151549 RepID=A0A4C1Y9X2_EUMVA|nr:hypothetical protein EVAR_88587_1 [Eumeta japonica]